MLLRLRHVQRTTRHAVPPLRAPRLTRAFASAAPEASDEASSSKEVTSSVSLTGAAAGAGTMPTTDTGTDTNTATSTHGRRRGARRMGTARSTRRTSSSHVVNHRALAVLDASVQRQLSCGSAKDVLSSTPLPPPPTRENAIDGRTAIPQHLLPDPSILDETLLVAQGLLHHPATRRTRLLALTADHPGANTYLEHVARTVAENMRAGFVVVELEQLVVAAHAVAHGERRLAARVGSVDDGGARKDFLRRGNGRLWH